MPPTFVASDSGLITAEELADAFQKLEVAATNSQLYDVVAMRLRGEVNLSACLSAGAECSKAANISLHVAKTISLEAYASPQTVETLTEHTEEVIEDNDESAVYPRNVGHGPTVEYDILLSSTYRVPVIYFVFRDLPPDGPQGLDAVYSYLIPADVASRLRKIGVLGGISITNHPQTDIPSFFVHPCNTAEAMQEITSSRSVTPLQYLQIWMGLIGASVGLNLPLELAKEIEKS